MFFKKAFSLSLFLLISISMLILSSCLKKDTDLQQLLSYMTGAFKGQGPAEQEFLSKDTRIQMVQIWKDNRDGYWLYREQANIINLDRPYLQRVLHLTRTDDKAFKIDIYELSEPLRFVGVWKEPGQFAELTSESLIAREGCSIVLTKANDSTFVGKTVGKDCPNSEADAAYATTEVKITKNEFYCWDRGFDTNDNQVWGPMSKGYGFEKYMDLKDASEIKALTQEFENIKERAQLVKAINTVRLVMKKASDVSRTEYHYDGAFRTGSTTTPVFDYNPDKHIKKSLREAGFKIISENSKEIEDATLFVNYAERKKIFALGAPSTFYFSFLLNHKKAGKLVEGGSKASGCESVKELKNDTQFRDLGKVVKKGLVNYVLPSKKST